MVDDDITENEIILNIQFDSNTQNYELYEGMQQNVPIGEVKINLLLNEPVEEMKRDEMNEDITRYCRDEFNLLVGEKTAEDVKIAIGSACPQEKKMQMAVRGRDLVTGLPKEIIIKALTSFISP